MSNLTTLAARSVHIRTKPIPRSLAETRLIFSALQKFGEVLSFRSLKYDTSNTSLTKSSTTLAIFDSPSSATAAIAASPLLIPIQNNRRESNNTRSITSLTSETDHNNTNNNSNYNVNNINNPNYYSTNASSMNGTAFSATTQHQPQDSQHEHGHDHESERSPFLLTCSIQPSSHNHESALKRNPFYTMFELERDTAQYRDLVEGSKIPLPELADVPTARKEFAPLKTRKRTAEGTKGLGGTSLMRLYREGFVVEREKEMGVEVEVEVGIFKDGDKEKAG